ncbi:hypothetical protein AGOR_G00210560 [Albula goreensis]|uniref:Lymphotoxin-alpha n=1 Tax=Albula goreensis TaxID=1534307 RepID=A0A8T3CRB2_9TELE|nr:hypothetical protein AGOR_G00210560 [Albula goreensis]
MAGYTMTPTDVEAGHGNGSGAVMVAKLEKASGTLAWRVCGAVTLFALCGAAALFFLLHVQTEEHGTDISEHQQHLKQISGNVRAAIHLQGEFDPQSYNNTVLWRDGDGHSFFQGGLKLKKNEIIIPQSGLYFVYSQVSFRVRCGSRDGRNDLPLSHMIMRWSDSFNNKVPLLSAVRSTCQNIDEARGKNWYNAVYLGAIFSLEAEDRLWTNTNRLKDIERDDGKTFFGVFAL